MSVSSATDQSILVIDDELRLAQSVVDLLGAEGYTAHAAEGGGKGIQLLKDATYGLVITDLRMPEVDGFQVMEYLAAHHPETAVIVITGHASTESAIVAIRNQVADYLTKPFDFDLLLAAIEKIFARRETEKLRRETVRMLTHDIKVPLSSILGYADFMIGGVDAASPLPAQLHPQSPQFARKILLNAQRILSMLDNFLMHTQAEGGRLAAHRRPVDLRDPVEEALRMVRGEMLQKNLALAVEIPPEPVMVSADETLILRAVANLLNNAQKYTPRHGRVELTLETRADNAPRPGSWVVVTVTNTGPGIAAEELAHIFDADRRSESSRGTLGSGLGLYVVQHVARAHDGYCDAESVPNEETTFRFGLPLG